MALGAGDSYRNHSDDQLGACTGFMHHWMIDIPKGRRACKRAPSCLIGREPIEHLLPNLQEEILNAARISAIPGVFDPCIWMSWQKMEENTEHIVYMLTISYENIPNERKEEPHGNFPDGSAPFVECMCY